ncbi:ATP-binding protein [Scytonema sp. UIC 10036]|uniref:helicase C-terminal domain-containing protein n=1 Tax=Scytonema sp. UIC 10036 TaxID=2304196 RepID=UPI0012DAA6BE|nr:helicase C-terminal domain-containing protein [Scytonema sp. UIC 10036]MUG93372.1 ATP-binding protein [Scytonema sp. UIC 10036]
MKIREAQGHLFELAFNAGILTAIHQSGMKYTHMDLFIDDLKRINHRGVVNKLVEMKLLEGFIDAESQRIWAGWGKLLLLRGHLGGLGLWKELMDSFGCSPASYGNWELLYMQCCLSDEASMRTLEKDQHERYSQILSQFGITVDKVTPYINKYADTGEFLKADTLLLLSKEGQKKKEYHIVCVDLSAFTVENSELNFQKDNDELTNEQELFDSWNLSSALSILESLKAELRYLISKSVYHKLKFDTQKGSNQQLIGEYIQDYLAAFSYYDKDFVKLVQAASYSASLVKFIDLEKRIPKDATIQVTAIGYTTRGMSTLNVGRDDFHILDLCANAYKSMKRQQKSDRENSINTYEQALSKMIDLIKRNAIFSLSYSPSRVGVLESEELVEKYQLKKTDNDQKIQEFVESLCDFSIASDQNVCFSETLTNFNNPSDLLDNSITSKYHLPEKIKLIDAHGKIIQEQLSLNCHNLLLTGNPGIGKTTAVVNFLHEHSNEGFLFFYISPRLSVNEDTINKFKDKLFADDLYCICTSHATIAGNNDKATVRYYSNSNNQNFERLGVTFISTEYDKKHITNWKNSINRESSYSLRYSKKSGTGVIRSLCDAGHALIKDGVTRIVITCSTQSLRKLNSGGDSLDNFQRLFRSVTNNGEVIPELMSELSSRMKHIIVMIDEVTGDTAGVEWFHLMKKWLGKKLELFEPSYGYNTKLIVADASLTGVDVVKPHLGIREAEPDKIYCSFVDKEQEPLAVSFQSFTNSSAPSDKIDSVIINVNSYPAKALELIYKVFFEVSKINEDGSINTELGQSARDESLVNEITCYVNNPDLGQLIVYIQDKQRLRQLISFVKKKLSRFDKNETYLEIHSQIPDGEMEMLLKRKNDVRVVFMTASAARGISFPLVKHIIVELPRFQIENNLMEIIQVIYRGRGEFGEGQNNDRAYKKVTVYIVEKVFTNVLNNQQSKITRAANLIGSLLVLRVAVMTRILGAGYLSGRNVAMIPIGGKAVYSSGETFSTRIKSLMQLLRSYHRLHPNDQDVELVLEGLSPLFKSSEFLVQPPRASNLSVFQEQTRKKISLLSLLESGVDFLFDQCSCMADLLEIEISPCVYMDGSLLIIPMNNHTVTSRYSIDPYSQIRSHIKPNFRVAIRNISQGNYSENIKNEISFAIDFIEHLLQNEGNTQQLSDSSNFSDQYLAVPLHFLVRDEILQRSFAGDDNSPVSLDFRLLLERYVKALYPANDFLPIGDGFPDFPWVIFKSYDLAHIRRSLFRANYFLNSRSLNLLNLILSRQ